MSEKTLTFTVQIEADYDPADTPGAAMSYWVGAINETLRDTGDTTCPQIVGDPELGNTGLLRERIKVLIAELLRLRDIVCPEDAESIDAVIGEENHD